MNKSPTLLLAVVLLALLSSTSEAETGSIRKLAPTKDKEKGGGKGGGSGGGSGGGGGGDGGNPCAAFNDEFSGGDGYFDQTEANITFCTMCEKTTFTNATDQQESCKWCPGKRMMHCVTDCESNYPGPGCSVVFFQK
mmetsp:Transcript_28286/g.53174  ORF Transcript_28286/g.53174 Transcript_28286/m.53174 type:complete len:137 (-) Transcript_28286:355-765(-)